ncbi:MAG TPA: hypothetical protein VG963_19485 [Polyangiaceae bacterium]|nr:hypothetical protein [Polyangiaceae bacterium]
MNHSRLWRLLLCGATGCAASGNFVPVEYATALSPDGEHGAAEYSLDTQLQQVGILQIWFQGFSREKQNGHPESQLHLGFMLVNLGEGSIELDAKSLFLEELRSRSGVWGRIAPSAVAGNTRVAPSYRQEVDVSFALPSETNSEDVESFRLAWAVHDGTTHAAQTRFLPAQERPEPHPREAYYGYCWMYPWPAYAWPYAEYAWPYFEYGWPHPGYGWPYYCGAAGAPYPVPLDGWGYWFSPIPGHLPPSYMRSRHR